MSGLPSEKDEGHNQETKLFTTSQETQRSSKLKVLHLETEEAEKFKYSDTYKLKQKYVMTLKYAGFSPQNTH